LLPDSVHIKMQRSLSKKVVPVVVVVVVRLPTTATTKFMYIEINIKKELVVQSTFHVDCQH